ncbi:bacillithiol biosynthesis deacetylase BshB1 [Candidatus Desantisbacteria bacterium]|nr:bacillithiol biosynthesis deacetylase BshB1 [Candidatus Desantisbacteria bacterium]
MKLDVLAIGAHRDDIELSCGGTIIKLVDEGYEVGVLDLTQGEAGTRGTAKERAREAKNAAKCMGITLRKNLYLPDAGVNNTEAAQHKIIHILRKYQPDMVIIPYWEGRHPDHYKTSILSYESCFFSGLSKLKIGGLAHRPSKIVYYMAFQETHPSFIIDITEQFQKKMEAIKCYKSQFSDSEDGKNIFMPANDIFELLEARARVYGAIIGKKYGEAFLAKQPLEIEDMMTIKGKFI